MSANDFQGTIIPGTAGEALTKFRFVKDTGTVVNETNIVKSGAGDPILGVGVDTYADGARCGIAIDGTWGSLEVNGNSVAIAKGDYLKSDANGIGVKSAADLEKFGAVALDPATADGVVIRVKVLTGERSTA